MKMAITILLIAAQINSLIVHASGLNTPTCKDAGLYSLRMHIPTPSGPPYPREVNFCDDLAKAPPSIQKILSHIQILNSRIAKFFGLPIADTFEVPLDVTLDVNNQGYYQSGFEGPQHMPLPDGSFQFFASSVQLGVFNDSDEQLNEGVYVHEVGHYLSLSKLPKVFPESYRELLDTTVFRETVADLLARAVTGGIQDQDSSMPYCFSQVRSLTSAQSYRSDEGFFDSFYNYRYLEKCCEDSRQISFNGDSRRWRNLCVDADERMRERDISPFPAWNASPLSSETAKRSTIDPHQIGIPLQSFLGNLASLLGISLGDLFREVFTVQVSENATLETFLQRVQKIAADHGQSKTFDDLWRFHGLSILIEVNQVLIDGSKATTSSSSSLVHKL